MEYAPMANAFNLPSENKCLLETAQDASGTSMRGDGMAG